MGVMNAVTSADSSYYAANMNEKTEKGPCLAMTPYGVIGAERVKGTFFLGNKYISRILSDMQHHIKGVYNNLCLLRMKSK